MISALVGHLVGDYLLQNDWMALNKKKPVEVEVDVGSFCGPFVDMTGPKACAVHCLIWTLCVVLFAWWPWWTAIPLFITHYIQDRTQIVGWWMDFYGQKQFRTGVCAPWSAIVVDNVFHIVTIWLIWKCL
jgi:hypothetical protein